jgi:hypothetical protein
MRLSAGLTLSVSWHVASSPATHSQDVLDPEKQQVHESEHAFWLPGTSALSQKQRVSRDSVQDQPPVEPPAEALLELLVVAPLELTPEDVPPAPPRPAAPEPPTPDPVGSPAPDADEL